MRERKRDGTCAPGKELWKRKVPTYGKSPQWWGDQPGQRGSFRASEDCAATGLQRAMQRETCTDDQCWPALPCLRWLSIEVVGAWCWGSGLGGQTLGRGLGLAVQRQPERAKVWCATMQGVWEEAWDHQRGKAQLLRSTQGEGKAHLRSFFLRAIEEGSSCCCHLRLQRKVWIPAATEGPVRGWRSLPPTFQEHVRPVNTKGPATWCQPLPLPPCGWVGPTTTAECPETWCQTLPLPPREDMQPAACSEGPAFRSQMLPPLSWECVCGPCTCTPPIKRIMASTHWGKRWQSSKPKTALTPKKY